MNRREFNFGVVGLTAACVLDPLGTARGSDTLRVNGGRLNDHLKALSEFGKNPQGGVSRVAYSDADKAGRALVMDWMRAAKVEPKIDLAGNIIGGRPGTDASLKPILFGSHIDSVPDGGNYDGDVGSLSAIEVAQTLDAAGVTLRHPLEVLIFQNEEGGTIGSHAISAGLTAAELDRVAQSGKTIRDGIRFLGGDPDRLESARRNPGDLAAYPELHIAP